MSKEKSLEKRSTSMFDIDGVPAISKAIPLSIQHLLAMVVGNIAPAIILAGVIDADIGTKTILIQSAMLIAGISTLLQLYPIGPFGARLPIITGLSFAFVPTLISLGSMYGIEGVFGAQIIGGIAAIVVGIFIKPLRKHFPPIVSGTVVLTIGISLYEVAAGYMAGGIGSTNFGDVRNWGVALLTLGVVLFCNQFTKGYAKLASILIGIIVGYVVSIPLGLVDFQPVIDSAWFSVPKPMPFKFEFHIDAAITCILVFIVAAVEIVGNITAITNGVEKREPTDKELSGGILGMGLASAIGPFFGGLPVSTFGQNVGLVLMTKVCSRFVIAISCVFMIAAGFIPKFGALATTVPLPVLGGATVTVFGTITMSGIQILMEDEFSSRNLTIAGLSVALGVGIVGIGSIGGLDQLPSWFKVIFGESAVVISSVIAFMLNLILPKKSLQEEAQEREDMEAIK